MDRVTMDAMAEELIEQAKQMSKEKFLTFAENMYGIDRETWEHLWEVPIVTTYEDEKIFPAELSSLDREEILDALDEYIEEAIGDKEAVFVPYDNIISSLPEEAAQEYETGVSDGSITEEYNAVIIYNEALLKKDFREHVKAGSEANPPRTQEEINKIYLGLVSETFLHERLHLNANALVIDNAEPDLLPLVNGAESEYDFNYMDYNEVLIDTMAKIMQTYSKGDSVQDCLYRVIESRGGKSAYKELDDRLVLSLFTLFPDELSKWTLLEAYEEHHDNLLAQKYTEVFGGKTVLRRDEMLKKVGEYFNQTAPTAMTTEQLAKRKEMLEMLGVKNINMQQVQGINVTQLRELATSESAMEQLSASFQDIKSAYNELKHPDQKEFE